MNEQNNTPTPISATEKTELLERRKQAMLHIIETTIAEIKNPMLTMMIHQYLPMVSRLLDNMTLEQTDEIIDRVQTIIDDIRG